VNYLLPKIKPRWGLLRYFPAATAYAAGNTKFKVEYIIMYLQERKNKLLANNSALTNLKEVKCSPCMVITTIIKHFLVRATSSVDKY
jgi:hypothetical protein